MTKKNIGLVSSTVALIAALVFAYQFGAGLAHVASKEAASAAPAPYYDLNQLKLYRASEWGVPAPASVDAAQWFDLRTFDDYWQSEHMLTVDRPLSPEQLYHDLMLVK